MVVEGPSLARVMDVDLEGIGETIGNSSLLVKVSGPSGKVERVHVTLNACIIM